MGERWLDNELRAAGVEMGNGCFKIANFIAN
jgi:hypothetical protein